MEKLNGKKRLKVSVFISGRGTNLKSLINFSKSNVELDSCKIYFIESEESRFVIKNCENRAFFNKTN